MSAWRQIKKNFNCDSQSAMRFISLGENSSDAMYGQKLKAPIRKREIEF